MSLEAVLDQVGAVTLGLQIAEVLEDSGETDSLPTTVPTDGGVSYPSEGEICERGVTEAEMALENPAELTPDQMIADLKAKLDEAQAELSDRRKTDAMIAEQSAAVEKQAMTVLSAESALKQAKGLRDSQKEKYDGLVNELRSMLRDAAAGQKRLDFDGDGQLLAKSEVDGVTVEIRAGGGFMTADPALTAPITELGTKFVKNLIGGEEFARRKEIEEPVGLTDGQLDKLAGTELHTIADLEKQMQASQFWSRDSGLGEKTADRVVNTLMVWRQHHPHVEQASEIAGETGDEPEDDEGVEGADT